MNNTSQTNIHSNVNMEKLKQQSMKSGLTYNQAKEWIAKNMNGSGTEIFSDTNAEEVRRQNQPSDEK